MQSTLFYLGLFIVPTVIFFNFLDVWMSKESHAALRERLAKTWLKSEESSPLEIIRLPLNLIASGLNRIYGKEIVSWRGFYRVAVTTTVIYVATLGIFGLVSGVPFSLENPPWQSFSESFETMDKYIANAKKDLPSDKSRDILNEWYGAVSAYKTPTFRVLHSLITFVATIGLASVFTFVNLAMGRKLLRDLKAANTGTSLLSLLVLTTIFGFSSYAATVSLLVLAALPLTIPLGLGILGLIYEGMLLFASGLSVLGVLFAIFISPAWVKLAGLVTTLPSLMIFSVAVITMILFPIRAKVRRFGSTLLDKALQHEKGPVVFVSTLAVLFESTIVFLAKTN